MNENQLEKKIVANEKKRKFLFRIAFILILLCLVYASFMWGSYNSCSRGGGYLIGYSCFDVNIIAGCEDLANGKVYADPTLFCENGK